MSAYKFNIRVYGLLLQDEKVLLTEEQIGNYRVIKFPGGGLEYGEGTIDCLKREFAEELNLSIQAGAHFYTTDFYQPSAFNDSQIISIYYLVSVAQPIIELENNLAEERAFWLPLQDLFEDSLTLPIDRVVAGLLHEHFLATRKEL